MLPTFRKTGSKSLKSFGSALAMAVALAGGAVLANAGMAAPVAAQQYSDTFVTAYTAVQTVVNSGAADLSGARPLIPAMLAAIQNADERNAAGNLLLSLGQTMRDPPLQRQGLELMLASGLVPAEAQGQYYYYLGNFALQARDHPAGRTALQRALDLGYMPAEAAADPQLDPRTQILQSFFFEENFTGLLGYANTLFGDGSQRQPELWLTYGLQGAIETSSLADATLFSQALVAHYPSERNWGNGLRVIGGLGDFDDQANLDLLRLMRLTGTLTEGNDFIRYIETADPRIMSNELVHVLAEGVRAGHFASGQTYYDEVKGIVDDRMAEDRADAPALVREARSAASGAPALSAGDVLYSLGDFAGAEAMYAMSVEKGSANTAAALTRLGMAQLRQGNVAAAQAALAQVTGPRAPIAQMWAAYARSLANLSPIAAN